MRTRSRAALLLVADTVRTHRWGIVAWALGGAATMYVVALGWRSEVDRFPGGAPALARSLRPGVEALRLLRWPADRLDTLGGYLYYHNILLFTLFLTVYATVQGGRVTRGEAEGALEQVLAAGRSRPAVVRDRAAGFAVTLTVICLGFGVGTAAALGAGGQPDPGGATVTALSMGLCALTGYAFGLVGAQLTLSPRAGTGAAVLALVVLYLLGNIAGELGPFGFVRYLSPFHWASASRALVAGYRLDPVAVLVLIAVAGGLLVAGARVFARRDCPGALLGRRPRPVAPPRRVQRPALRTVWSATLLRQRTALVTWCLSGAVLLGVMAGLEPSVEDVWARMRLPGTLPGQGAGVSVADQYLAYVAQFVAPLVAAYVVTQAAGWVADLRQGRVELVLAAPVTWPSLVAQRILAAMVGAAAITASGLVGLGVGTAVVGVGLVPVGLVRLAADTLLLATALVAVAALLVAWVPDAAAVTVLALLFAASYLLVLLVPLFGWPDWIVRASIFGAYGDPYLRVPPTNGLVVLAAVAVLGTLLATVVAARSPKTA